MKKRALLVIASIVVSSHAFAEIHVNLNSDQITITGTDAELMYASLVNQGAEEKSYPELPIPPDKEYGMVSSIEHKNIYCSVQAANLNYRGVSLGVVGPQTLVQCFIGLESSK